MMCEKSVLLIFPASKWELKDTFCQPLGILTLGAALKQAGIKVSIIDLSAEGWSKRKFHNYLKNGYFSHIGVTVLSPFREIGYEIIDMAKKVSPEIITIVGGPHASLRGEKILAECQNIDIAVSGEAELDIVDIINNPLKRFYDLGVVEDIDKCPIPDRSFIRHLKYTTFSGIWVGDSTSMKWIRGCQWRKCTFCSRSELTISHRRRTPEKIIEEIAIIQNELKYKNLFVVDDSLMFKSKYVKTILEMKIKEGLDIPFWALARADHLDDESLGLLRKANCSGLEIGIEAAAPRVIEMYKKTDLKPTLWKQKLESTFELADKHNILTIGTVIVGGPYETKNEIQQTTDLCKNLKVDVIQAFPFLYIIGSELWKQAIEQGQISSEQYFTYNDKKFATTEFTTEELIKMAMETEHTVNSPLKNPSRYIRIVKKFIRQRKWSMIGNNFIRLPLIIKNFLFEHPYEVIPDEYHQ